MINRKLIIIKSNIMKKIFFITLLISQLTFSQNTIRLNTGFAGYGNPFDGYYFSTDIGFEILNGIQIAPTFTFETSSLKKQQIEYYKNDIDGKEYFINKNRNNGEKSAGLIEIYLLVNPFKYFKNKKINSIDFGIGAGYGYSIYSDNYYNYSNPSGDFIGIIHKSGVRNSYSFKIFYNYHIKSYALGVIFGATDLHDDGVSIFGFQLSKML